MYQIVLIRHGQSVWNKENRFTGWKNVELSEQGIEEAKSAGARLKENNFSFDTVFTSALIRAQKTAALAIESMGISPIVIEDWRLNERHYGGLTGLDKKETADKHGAEQVHIWRRSYDTPPPKMEEAAAQEIIAGSDMPICYGESLKMTVDRVVPYWEEAILPAVKEGKKVLVAAHGNSIRGLMKHIFHISDEQITGLEIPTGTPVICELDETGKGISHKFLE
jgi:2,3-bisphosphoglycerate-dependent phosphoglycerate mutase